MGPERGERGVRGGHEVREVLEVAEVVRVQGTVLRPSTVVVATLPNQKAVVAKAVAH